MNIHYSSDLVGAWVTSGRPVPEPATIFLFGLGILSIAEVSRKKMKSKTVCEAEMEGNGSKFKIAMLPLRQSDFFWEVRMKLIAGLITGLLLFCIVGVASAVTIYQQTEGPVAGWDWFKKDNNYVAHDFSISNDSYLSSFTFNAITGNLGPAIDMYLKIFNNSNNEIGSLLHDISVMGVAPGSSYQANQSILQDYTMTLPNIHLSNGNYWVALHVETTIENPQVSWAIPTWATIGNRSRISTDGINFEWDYQHAFEQSFKFEGTTVPVPEPATMLLFGLGILGLAGVSRKK